MNTTYTTMNSKKYILFALLLSSTMVCAQHRKAKPIARKNVRNAATANPMNARQQENFNAMLPNTQSIFVVDSTIVDKNRVVETIPLSPKYGKFVSYNSFFDTDTQPNQYVFINGFANKCYYTELSKDSVQHLYTRNKLGDGWGEPHRISEIDSKLKHISYPFLSSDGQTLYVSGIADDGLGKRDIYVAKYNADEGTYFEQENIGLPFNSHDDDFIYVESDAERFAWFATTRRQPEGKACVYAFAMPEQRTNYNADEMSESRLKSLASLIRIRDTWPTPEIRERAQKELNAIKEEANTRVAATDKVNFVVNDDVVYTDIKSFRSDATRQMYYEVMRLQNDSKNKQRTLNTLREKYHNTADNNRTALTRDILQLEQQLDEARQQLKRLEAQLRTAENKLIKK